MPEQPETSILENEAEIIERAKEDDQAFEILYNYYFPKIYGYLFKRVGNNTDTEDLTSKTFMKVFSNLKGYSHQGHTFGAWVYKIATNNLIDYYRKQEKKKEININHIQDFADPSATPEEAMQNFQDYKLVNLVLKKLSKKHQQILHLKFFAEMSNNEIAEILKTTVNNVRVLTYRALKDFNKKYEIHK